VELPTGQQVDYAPATGLTKPRLVDVSRLTAWRHGQMIFENRPLAEVVGELSRYHRGKIIITNATLGGLLLTGVFDTKDGDDLLDAVAATLPVRVIRLPWLTIIQPASNFTAASPH
jgi:transmembrane sensor